MNSKSIVDITFSSFMDSLTISFLMMKYLDNILTANYDWFYEHK